MPALLIFSLQAFAQKDTVIIRDLNECAKYLPLEDEYEIVSDSGDVKIDTSGMVTIGGFYMLEYGEQYYDTAATLDSYFKIGEFVTVPAGVFTGLQLS